MSCFSGRVPLILFVFLIFGVSIFASRSGVFHKFFSGYASSFQQVEVTEELLLERWAMAFPDVIVRLSKMTPQQKELFIEQMHRVVVSLAFESGQSREQAHKFGETFAMALSKVIFRPAIANTYF